MRAVYAESINSKDPLSGLVVGERPEPQAPEGWARVTVKAAALNHHDVWSLRGQGLTSDALPMILGCDAAGVDEEGNEFVVHAVISDPGFTGTDETTDPRRSLLSERYQGTFADTVVVPRRNLVPKPEGLSMVEAACLPTAWLTAYRMLFVRSGLRPGQTVLVQGAAGGVATAARVTGGGRVDHDLLGWSEVPLGALFAETIGVNRFERGAMSSNKRLLIREAAAIQRTVLRLPRWKVAVSVGRRALHSAVFTLLTSIAPRRSAR